MNRIAWGLWWIAVVIQLLTQTPLLSFWQPLSQVLLMPILILVLITNRPRSGWTFVWTLGALFWSWLGDTAPKMVSEEWGFLAMLGAFFVAQLCWIAALAPRLRHSALRKRRGLLVFYALFAVALLAVTLPVAGAMAPFVVAYAVVLLAMAITATGWGLRAALGGAIFMVSDSLIALTAFIPALDLAGSGFVVMLTYMVAQAILVWAVTRKRRWV